MVEGPQLDDDIDGAALTVVAALPAGHYYPEGGEDVFQEIIGATIVRIGGTCDADIEGGGLIIDYRPRGTLAVRRVVLGFNEAGAWVEWAGPATQSSQVAGRQ